MTSSVDVNDAASDKPLNSGDACLHDVPVDVGAPLALLTEQTIVTCTSSTIQSPQILSLTTTVESTRPLDVKTTEITSACTVSPAFANLRVPMPKPKKASKQLRQILPKASDSMNKVRKRKQ